MRTIEVVAVAVSITACAPTFQNESQRTAYDAFWQCQRQEVAVDIHFVRVEADGKVVFRGPDDDPHLKRVGDCLTRAGHQSEAVAEHEVEVEGPGSF
jgi:hypothetical protein